VIKRIWFDAAGEEPWWLWALDAPDDAAPLRVTESIALPDLEPDPAWERLGMASFLDLEHLACFDSWSGGSPRASLVVEEVVVRGGD
jgi:hypothetical protein